MSTGFEKKFSIGHTFQNVLKTSSDVKIEGETETHFNIPWKLSGIWSDFPYFFNVYLECPIPENSGDWLITVVVDSRQTGLKTCTFSEKFSKNFLTQFDICNMYPMLIGLDFPVEFSVKIEKITGLRRLKSRSFDDETARKFADVTLVLENQKFHVSKLFLASHSKYFDALLLGNFREAKNLEVIIKDIEPYDFQNFLEIIHGETFIDDDIVEEVLRLADFFDAKTATKICEEHLIQKSEKPLKIKFHTAIKYNLTKLKRKCMSEMKTKDDVTSVTPDVSTEFDSHVWADLFHKLASLK